MENTLLQNLFSNFDLMDNQHFLDWLKENKNELLRKERDQIIDAFDDASLDGDKLGSIYFGMEFNYKKI